MARYKVTASEASKHRAERFGTLTISPDRRVRLSKERAHPSLTFSALKYRLVPGPDGVTATHAYYDSSNYSLNVWYRGFPILTFVVQRNRVVDATFAVVPDVHRIERWVTLLLQAGFTEWVKPALYNTLRSMTHSPYASATRLRAMHELIERVSCELRHGPAVRHKPRTE